MRTEIFPSVPTSSEKMADPYSEADGPVRTYNSSIISFRTCTSTILNSITDSLQRIPIQPSSPTYTSRRRSLSYPGPGMASRASTELHSPPGTPRAPPPTHPLPLPPISGSATEHHRPYTSNSPPDVPSSRHLRVPSTQRSFPVSSPPVSRSAGASQRIARLPPPAIGHATAPQASPQTPEQIMRTIRNRSRDSYIAIHRPSVPDLKRPNQHQHTESVNSRSNSTKSAPVGPVGPSISSYSGKGSFQSSVATAPIVPTLPSGFRKTAGSGAGNAFGGVGGSEIGCFPTSGGSGLAGFAFFGGGGGSDTGNVRTTPRWDDAGCFGGAAGAGGARGNPTESGDDYGPTTRTATNTAHVSTARHLKKKVRSMLKGFHVSVSISFRNPPTKPEEFYKQPPSHTHDEMTVRIKNSKTGNCIFEVIRHDESEHSMETIRPVEDLRDLFPYDKNLGRSLQEWNRHFQNPPPHWVVNFIPRAYLRRGFFLAEEVCEYFRQHPNGCSYRVEYEPIGHEWCLVGTVVPKRRDNKTAPTGELYWEGREKQ